MRFLDGISIKARLWGSFGAILALLVVMVGLSAVSGRSAVSDVNRIVEAEFAKYELVAEIDSLTKSNARNTLELFVVEPDQRGPVRARMATTRQRLDELFKTLEPMLYLPKGQALFQDMTKRRGDFVTAFSKAAKTLEAGDVAAAQTVLRQEVLPAIDALAAPVDELLKLQQSLATERGHAVSATINQQNIVNMGLGALALVFGLVAAAMMVRSIMGPLQHAMAVAAEVATGNLTVEVHAHGNNELTRLLESLNQMKDSLAQVMMRIQESASQVAAASSEIAAANIDLSARTESQASSLEETAASMEQMTSSVQQNLHITQTANEMADVAARNAREVGQLVGSVVETMQDIHASSQRIRDIISVIDSIAFQTNILALNAAVEAARAGEQGRGFAVVASEVRSLAQRSAAAAQEIKTIIQDNVAKMDNGNQVAAKAGDSVGTVVGSIEKVNQTVAEVALSTKEQSSGIEQVGEAISVLDQATQQNAALVEETAAASKNLDDQVQSLKVAINRFRIGGKGSGHYMALGSA
jgi:methyl-accepting chemotaxis protein